MNAKEEILRIIKDKLHHEKEECNKYKLSAMTIESKNKIQSFYNKRIEMLNHLITATENAIFDVPSEEDIVESANAYGFISKGSPTSSMNGFLAGCKYILNYKKT